MRIWFISDTHTCHRYLSVPNADMVIHCGDESNNSDPALNYHEALDFFNWYSHIQIEHKIFVPGNHSTAIQAGLIPAIYFPKVHFLIHSKVHINGIDIFGSPYTPAYGRSWAYMKKRNRMKPVWDSVPACDILVTHGPPKGILDLTKDQESGSVVQVGCKSLANMVRTIQPKIHAFGHVHDESGCSNFGTYWRGTTTYINCSSMKGHKRELNNGFVLDTKDFIANHEDNPKQKAGG